MAPRTMKWRYSLLRGSPSSKTTCWPPRRCPGLRDVEALDAQRGRPHAERLADLVERLAAGGQVAGPAQLVPGERVLRVALDRLHERPLVAALGHPQRHPAAPVAGKPVGQRVGVGGQLGDQQLAGHVRLAVLAAVHLGAEVVHQVAGAQLLGLLHHPAALAAHPPVADVEDLHGGFQRVVGEGHHVGVGAVAEHHGLLLHGPAQRCDVVAQPRGPLELQLLAGLGHLPFQLADHGVGAAGHEVAEAVDDVAVLVGGDAADAGRGALADVPQQAGPAHLTGPLEHARGAGPRREDAQQQVEGLADRPGVRVRPEVAHPLALGAAHHLQAGVLLVEGDRQVWVRLVVAVADVEPGVVLLDPGELLLERLDLGGDGDPVHRLGGEDHLPGALVQVDRVGEVRVEPAAQAPRLADVDHPAGAVTEAVDPR